MLVHSVIGQCATAGSDSVVVGVRALLLCVRHLRVSVRAIF